MADRRIKVQFGRTIQTAPYESMRLDVSIEKDLIPDMKTGDEIDTQVDGLAKYVDAKLKSMLKVDK